MPDTPHRDTLLQAAHDLLNVRRDAAHRHWQTARAVADDAYIAECQLAVADHEAATAQINADHREETPDAR